MGAAVSVRDRVRVAEDLVVVGVVVLKNHIGEYIVGGFLSIVVDFNFAFAVENDWLFVDESFVFAELCDKFFDAFRIEKRRLFGRLRTFVFEVDGQSRVEEREFAQAGGEAIEFKFDGIDEDRSVWEERDHRTGFAGVYLADDVERDGGFSAFESDEMDFAIAHDFRFEPI